MRRVAVAAASLVAVTGLFGATAPQAGAAGTSSSYAPVVGELIGWTHGLPTRVHRGSTITFAFYYKQTSRENMRPLIWGMGLQQGPAALQHWTTSGVVVTWWDPATRAWEKPTVDSRDHLYGFYPKMPADEFLPTLAPYQLGQLVVRVTFTHAARLGQWRETGGVAAYQLYTHAGRATEDTLRPSREVLYGFTVVP